MSNLPSIPELIADDKMSVRDKLDIYNQHINAEPNPQWLTVNPNAPRLQYIPIQRVEWLLTKLFKDWRVEMIDTVVIANSVVVTVRLHVLHPITGEWTYNDGIGASPIITNKGASATDFSQVQSMSVMKAAPAAKSFAVKDAAELFGKILGRDLNRAENIAYGDIMQKNIDERKPDDMVSINEINAVIDALKKADIPEDEREYYGKLSRKGMTWNEYGLTMSYLQSNEADPIRSGNNYSQTDIINKLKKSV